LLQCVVFIHKTSKQLCHFSILGAPNLRGPGTGAPWLIRHWVASGRASGQNCSLASEMCHVPCGHVRTFVVMECTSLTGLMWAWSVVEN